MKFVVTYLIMLGLCCGIRRIKRAILGKMGEHWVLDRYTHLQVIHYVGKVPKYRRLYMPWDEFEKELERYIHHPIAYQQETRELRKQAEERLKKDEEVP